MCGMDHLSNPLCGSTLFSCGRLLDGRVLSSSRPRCYRPDLPYVISEYRIYVILRLHECLPANLPTASYCRVNNRSWADYARSYPPGLFAMVPGDVFRRSSSPQMSLHVF